MIVIYNFFSMATNYNWTSSLTTNFLPSFNAFIIIIIILQLTSFQLTTINSNLPRGPFHTHFPSILTFTIRI